MDNVSFEDFLSGQMQASENEKMMGILTRLLDKSAHDQFELLSPIEKWAVLHKFGLFGHEQLTFEEIGRRIGTPRRHASAEVIEQHYNSAMKKICKALWRWGFDVPEDLVEDKDFLEVDSFVKYHPGILERPQGEIDFLFEC